jgi:pyruvate,water dikinase
MDPYLEFSEGFIENQDSYMSDASFRSLIDNTAIVLTERMLSSFGSMGMALWAKYRLGTMFASSQTNDGEPSADDLLVSLCMDLKGNPTSEMGHAMVRLAVQPEIQDTNTAEDFIQRLSERSFSEEFMTLYEDFMKRYGFRGMKEIDAASTRTYEEPGVFFKKLKQIDPENNAINRVQERRKEATEKLLTMSKELGRETDFLYYDNLIRSLLGYREHPKYMSKN